MTELARGKLTKILGADQGLRVFTATMRSLQLVELESSNDLYAFANALTAAGGITAAVGALLGVAAVIRGADGSAPVG